MNTIAWIGFVLFVIALISLALRVSALGRKVKKLHRAAELLHNVDDVILERLALSNT